MNGILKSGFIKPSLKASNPKDAQYGDGQYFTDIVPGTKTNGQLGREFKNMPNKNMFTNYVGIEVSGLNVVNGREGVYVMPNSTPLYIGDRIVDVGEN